ncbi:MAG TPA: DUF4062 domain-containing protein, partial [Candidatus Angelobacter sp.]|nr:DUF4062 domain-containing protein [Candidatus Angelobacter sp.]
MRERVIRVFVSSTFRDMHAERDHLVKFVFPELRKLCERRSVTWAEVDLRWGITDEQAAEGKLLPICIEEVHRCQPYFIGLLGERYGAVPRNMPAQLVKEQPWLQEHCGCSLTELEMIHGVLREPRVPGPALFYFRDRAYLEHLPEGASRSDFEAEDDQACEKLASLKQRIRRAQQEQACGLRENYRDPEELGQWILTDFTHLIDELFPEDQQPGVLDQESAGHESFARSRRGVYIGRPEYFRLLDAHAANQELPLVLYGESGSGKSALLANWGARYCAANPEVFVLMHFIGATGSSSDRAEMLRRLMGEIKRRFQITGEIPDRVEDLAVAFVNWLHIAAAQGPMILILDGLNQLEDRDGALELVWLPPVIPSNVRMFLSTLPGRPLDELQKRGWPTFEIKLLDRAERMQLLEQYLAQYTKALERPRAEAIVAAPQTANPLYLRALLNELRVFGEYEGLNDRILYYLEAGNVRALYQKILRRWEADYDGGTNLVRRASTLIWAARRGLAESELFD